MRIAAGLILLCVICAWSTKQSEADDISHIDIVSTQ